MILQECSPDQDVGHSRLLRNIFSVGLPRAHGAQPPAALIDGLGCLAGGGLVADGVKDVFEAGRRLFDGLNHVVIAVVEDMLRAQGLDPIEVTRAARRDYFEALHRCYLDGVQADAR